jgi:cytochrome P450
VHRRVESALANLDEFVRALVAARRESPGDDLLSQLLSIEEAGDRLTTVELVALVENLMFAGHDTTRGAIGAAVEVLATHPRAFDEIRADPGLVENAAEEILRWEAITFGTARLASQDCSIAGVPVAGGTPVCVCLCSASRDPRRYREPERFDVHRADIRPPTFGAGVHFCLGAALARVELQEAVRSLTTRFSAVDLSDPPARWTPFAHIRRFEALPVCVTAA